MKPASFQTNDWLDWFTFDTHDEPCCKPFKIDGGRAATDGRYAIATTEDGPAEDLPKSGRRSGVGKTIMEWLAEDSPCLPGTLEMVLEACPKHAGLTEQTCPKCRGIKKVPHRCNCEYCDVDDDECPACDGLGKVLDTPEENIVLFSGVPFDGHRIGYILAHCPPTANMTFHLQGKKHSQILRIKTPTWQAILMQMAKEVAKKDCRVIA